VTPLLRDLVRKDLLGVEPYLPGKPLRELERELGIREALRFANNESPLGPSPRALAAIAEHAPALNFYPDGGSFYLRQAIASRFEVPVAQVAAGNGSNELIVLTVLVFVSPGEEVVIPHPSFAMYDVTIRAFGGTPVAVPNRADHRIDLDGMAAAVNGRTKVVIVCNPNNPTGTMVTRGEVEAFMARLPDHVVVVFDEAYAEYADGPDFPDARRYLAGPRPVILLRTFSKIHSLAGLRVGYGIASEGIPAYFDRVRLPYNVNLLAQEAALASLADHEHARRNRDLAREGVAWFREFFDREVFRRAGWRMTDSVTNFFLLETDRPGARLADRLAREGLIIRPMASFGLPANFVRITVGMPEANRRLAAAIEAVLPEPF
jgi:histidinol-phosphate aminotransferase